MEETLIPEWVDIQAKATNGYDILGLRQPAQNIGYFLFNGVTTISPRVRILSIRAWLIKAFSERGLPDNYSSLIDFVSRVECAISLGILAHDRSASSIPGAIRGRKLIDQGKKIIQLERLLDQMGFLAYAGPSYDLLISFERENYVSGLTKERGFSLALTFEELIKSTQFYNLLKKNPAIKSVSINVLRELGSAIDIDNIGVKECNALLDAILPQNIHEGARESERNRLLFYTLVLELALRHQRIPDEDDIFDVAVNPAPGLPDVLSPTLDGFLLYLMRDSLAVLHEAALDIISNELERADGYADANELIIHIVEEMIDIGLQKIRLISSKEKHTSISWNTLVNRVEAQLKKKSFRNGLWRWETGIDENAIISLASENKETSIGLLPLAWYLCQRRLDKDNNEDSKLEYLSQQGGARMGLAQVLFPELQKWKKLNPSIAEISGWLIKRTVEQHLRISWSRMSVDFNRDVAVIISDGEKWRFRKNFEGGRTASRVGEAIDWLRQLGLIDEAGLPELGKSILTRNYKTLALVNGAL